LPADFLQSMWILTNHISLVFFLFSCRIYWKNLDSKSKFTEAIWANGEYSSCFFAANFLANHSMPTLSKCLVCFS
jgi:hypothetical protein